MAAEPLGELAKRGGMQEDGERPADARAAAARTGTDRLEQRALGRR
jgi:hypothetical protein